MFKEEKYFYRIGKEGTGLWYNKHGQFTGTIHSELSWLQISKLEMPFEQELVGYLSAVDNLQHLYQWFNKDEIKELQLIDGYFIEEWISTDYKFYDLYQHNVINQKTSVLNNKYHIH